MLYYSVRSVNRMEINSLHQMEIKKAVFDAVLFSAQCEPNGNNSLHKMEIRDDETDRSR